MKSYLSLIRPRYIALVTLALALGAGAAIAAPETTNSQSKPGTTADHGGPGHRGHDPFARWDPDNDGKIVLKELPEKPQAHLAAIDSNKDGTLTREEFARGREQLRAAREKELDRNHDGKVTEDERKTAMRTHLLERFAEDDKNHDGFLTSDELPGRAFERMSSADRNQDKKLSQQEISDGFANGTLGPRGHGHEGRGPEGRGPKSEAERKAHFETRFKADDKNQDGFLIESEIPQQWAHLKQADANNDSKLSRDELRSALDTGKLRPAHRGHGPRR